MVKLSTRNQKFRLTKLFLVVPPGSLVVKIVINNNKKAGFLSKNPMYSY